MVAGASGAASEHLARPRRTTSSRGTVVAGLEVDVLVADPEAEQGGVADDVGVARAATPRSVRRGAVGDDDVDLLARAGPAGRPGAGTSCGRPATSDERTTARITRGPPRPSAGRPARRQVDVSSSRRVHARGSLLVRPDAWPRSSSGRAPPSSHVWSSTAAAAESTTLRRARLSRPRLGAGAGGRSPWSGARRGARPGPSRTAPRAAASASSGLGGGPAAAVERQRAGRPPPRSTSSSATIGGQAAAAARHVAVAARARAYGAGQAPAGVADGHADADATPGRRRAPSSRSRPARPLTPPGRPRSRLVEGVVERARVAAAGHGQVGALAAPAPDGRGRVGEQLAGVRGRCRGRPRRPGPRPRPRVPPPRTTARTPGWSRTARARSRTASRSSPSTPGRRRRRRPPGRPGRRPRRRRPGPAAPLTSSRRAFSSRQALLDALEQLAGGHAEQLGRAASRASSRRAGARCGPVPVMASMRRRLEPIEPSEMIFIGPMSPSGGDVGAAAQLDASGGRPRAPGRGRRTSRRRRRWPRLARASSLVVS